MAVSHHRYGDERNYDQGNRKVVRASSGHKERFVVKGYSQPKRNHDGDDWQRFIREEISLYGRMGFGSGACQGDKSNGNNNELNEAGYHR